MAALLIAFVISEAINHYVAVPIYESNHTQTQTQTILTDQQWYELPAVDNTTIQSNDKTHTN